MTTLEKRYQTAIRKIGYQKMLNLPDKVKEILTNTRNLETKVKMLEEIAKML